MAPEEFPAEDVGEVIEDPVVEGTMGSLVFALGLWSVVLYAVVAAFDFHASARMLPHIIGIPTLLVATLIVGLEASRWRHRRRSRSQSEGSPRDIRSELEACGWFAAYSVGVLLVGFAAASLIFMLTFLRLYGREKWLTIVLLTGVILGIIVGVFDGLLNIRIYDGWLQSVLAG